MTIAALTPSVSAATTRTSTAIYSDRPTAADLKNGRAIVVDSKMFCLVFYSNEDEPVAALRSTI
jgi:hypothetical protein